MLTGTSTSTSTVVKVKKRAGVPYFNIYAISHTPSNIYVEIYRSTLQDIYFSFFVYNLIHCTGWCRDDDDDDDVFGVLARML